jgi:hypothetical protein
MYKNITAHIPCAASFFFSNVDSAADPVEWLFNFFFFLYPVVLSRFFCTSIKKKTILLLKTLLYSSRECKKGLSCKSTSSYFIVRPNGRWNCNAILEHLISTDASRHSFVYASRRPYGAVIRNLHHITLTTDITKVLIKLVFCVRASVIYAKSISTTCLNYNLRTI